MSRMRAMATGFAVRAVLNRLTSSGPDTPPAGGTPPGPVAEPAADRRRAVLPLTLFLIGVVAMVPFESTATRIIGVLALGGFVVSGVFAIADPRWLGSATDDEPS